MLGLSSSCDATVRLTRKASIPEKPGDVKEFVSLSENCFRSDIVFDSDIAFAVIFALREVMDKHRNFGVSRNIILATVKL